MSFGTRAAALAAQVVGFLAVTSAVAAGSLTAPTPTLGSLGEFVYLIPAGAHTPGESGTVWRTDLHVLNAGDGLATVDLFFLPSGRDNHDAAGVRRQVGAWEQLAFEDILSTTFGTSGSGALLVSSDVPVAVTSRTYNSLDQGTFGQHIPAIALDSAVASFEEVRLIQLTQNEAFRTNVGVCNAGDTSLTVQVEVLDSGGSPISTRTFTVPPFGHHQQAGVIDVEVDSAVAVITSGTPGARYLAYASVVDNASGDPVLVLPVGAQDSAPIYISGTAHTVGIAGTTWVTDLEVHNPCSTAAEYTIELLERDRDNSTPELRAFVLEGNHSARFRDVLAGIFGLSGGAALRVTPTAGAVMVTSRTFNDAPSGTFGQFIAGQPQIAAIGPDEEGRLPQLSRSTSGETGRRTNLGLTNAGPEPLTVNVELISGDGHLLGVRHIELRPFEHVQRTDIFGEVTQDQVPEGYAIVSTTTPGGQVFAYASVIDNSTGDPVYLPAVVSEATTPPPPVDQQITVTLPGGVTMDLAHIPGGVFWMGSPDHERARGTDEELHRVGLTSGFYLGTHEVTHAQWRAVMGTSTLHSCGLLGIADNDPVYCVSWHDVCGGSTGADCVPESFIGRLNQLLGTDSYRLPTDAEWERAARGGSQTPFSFGDDLSCSVSDCSFCPLFDRYMVWCGNDKGRAEEPRNRLPNQYGLYDMHGNLHEWVADWYTAFLGTLPETDPTGPESGIRRVRRGGYFNLMARFCRSATRAGRRPESRSSTIGFRVARSE